MATWTFEPGHTSAFFRARHMMVTWVRGGFAKAEGTLTFDPAKPEASAVEATFQAAGLWSGDPERDAHLKSEDFLHVEEYPTITFRGDEVTVVGEHDFVVRGDLTIRGVTKPAELEVSYLGQWSTPWWEEEPDGNWVNKGPKRRAGFTATTMVNRHDFGVSWNDTLDAGGIVVGDYVYITLDAEAILDD